MTPIRGGGRARSGRPVVVGRYRMLLLLGGQVAERPSYQRPCCGRTRTCEVSSACPRGCRAGRRSSRRPAGQQRRRRRAARVRAVVARPGAHVLEDGVGAAVAQPVDVVVLARLRAPGGGGPAPAGRRRAAAARRSGARTGVPMREEEFMRRSRGLPVQRQRRLVCRFNARLVIDIGCSHALFYV